MRLIDLSASALGLIVLSPLFLFIALLVKLTSAGPVFYRALRVGQGGRLFRLYKFRTMVAEADRLGPGITTASDTRITVVGRWLRRTKLDELPQLINVVKGDLGLVGPRPEDPRYVALYSLEQRAVLAARPGITSAASLLYRNESSLLTGPDWEHQYRNQVLPAKLKIELDYLQDRSLWGDVRLILTTVATLLLRR
jgi:lipopolysaccharide/colanic/teichoic acid biosynthesis glycosyltransferase